MTEEFSNQKISDSLPQITMKKKYDYDKKYEGNNVGI